MTKARKVVIVEPAKDGWIVQEQRGAVLSTHRTKAKAVAAGKAVAKRAPLGQIKIMKANGRIQTEYTYGEDPRSKRG
jgi:hypothetical protein